jgi:AAA family ATP:ADP antiporter
VGRLRLVALVTLFFAANLVVFFVLGRLGFPVGVPFFLWVGVFSVTVIAQFWSLANDLVTPEQGKRLFAVVGIGSSLGAVFGARVARALFDLVGLWGLLLAAAAFLLGSLGLTALASRQFEREARGAPPAPLAPAGGFALLAKDRYLQLIAALVLILNLVNTTGEYVLDRTLLASVAGQPQAVAAASVALFKARYFQWVNIASVGLQLFAVSRVMRHLGMRAALMLLPLLAMGGYGSLAFAPLLSVAFMTKVAENSVDYSLQNTARQALFLPTSREAKYQAKVTIDTFLVRGGDVLSAALVWLGIHLHVELRCFALVNVVFAGAWMMVAWRLGARHGALTAPVVDGSPAPVLS